MDDLKSIFDQLKDMLEDYQPPFQPKVNAEGGYDLWSVKDVEILGRKRTDIYFAGIVIRKGYVGFYYMPVYAEPEIKAIFKPELLRRLKGKSCFHINKLTPELKDQISEALQLGFKKYQQNGWV